MPQNLTQIANSTLIKLGANTVSALSDSTREAGLVRERILPVIQRLLREHPWHFALKLTQLAPLVESPIPMGGWTYAFQIPPDCLRIRALDTKEYEIVGSLIYSNTDSLLLRYTQRLVENIESAVQLQDDFADAASAFLAYDISPSITSALEMRGDLMAWANRLLAQARFNGSIEVPQYQLNESSWLESRLTWNGEDRRLYPLDV